MPVSVKIGGVWKTATAVYNKVGGVWKTAADMPVKIAGVWKTGILAQGAFESIATVAPTTGNTVTFSSIPGTYKHLQIRYLYGFPAGTTGIINTLIYFNGSTTGYAWHQLQGDGTSVTVNGYPSEMGSIRTGVASTGAATLATSAKMPSIVDIVDYASTTKNKTVRSFSGSSTDGVVSNYVTLNSGVWVNTAAITSITIFAAGGTNWGAGSHVALYGVK